MELLTIHHQDFTMSIECTKFEGVWGKAVQNVGKDKLTSRYTWSDGVEKVVKYNECGQGEELICSEETSAIFFDNADYPIWVDFKSYVKHAEFGSMLKNENERFSFRKNVLAGFVNYNNEIGKSEINIVYQVGAETKHFTFGFEVLSTKLDYHEHWNKIIEDIETEYRMLSLDYMRRTFHGFTPDDKGETPELIWWNIFSGEREKFIKACKNIIERPRRRLRGYETYQRADKIKRVPVSIENELAEHRSEATHLYRIEEHTQSNDTQENRFLKYALSQIIAKYETLKKYIESIGKLSDVLKDDMDACLDALKHIQRNPFFRTIGRFKGLNQESLVLQKATGYSQVYRTWNLLRRSYSLQDGMYRLQTKDIATLYEIWCFIEVSHIVKEQLGIEKEEIEHRNRMEMNGLFTWELGKGEHSRILFRKNGVELAELVYNPKHTEKGNDSISMPNLVVPTVSQKPDIVLQLSKNDINNGMKMTYLFDAKYRIDRRENGADIPPEDAINQMHRYRDAIYYKDYDSEKLKKEVIGGYILFPGAGEPLDVAKSRFYETIKEVNIGAFPLRPKDERNRALLEEFIQELINARSSETIAKVIPQKGTVVHVPNRVLVGVVKPSRKGYLGNFEDRTAKRYYTGPHFPTTIPLQNLHFFVPYISGKGIRDVYRIIGLRTIKGSEIHPEDKGEKSNDLRLAFELEYNRSLGGNYIPINTNGFIMDTFLDTTFDEILNLHK
ncbi:MAG: DUF2357 domain-containing protein [Bacteroides sp.]|nr:DUF2357 domain-containing protein [Bacteroides sp.]